MTRLVLPVPPSSNRYWRTFRNRAVRSREANAYALHVSRLAATVTPLTGPLAVTLIWYRARKSGDLDNRIKCALDALQGHAYANDSQIVELHAHRSDADPKHPRVEVTISTAAAPTLSAATARSGELLVSIPSGQELRSA